MTVENNPDQENLSFADMLAAQDEEQTKSRFEAGQRVKATIVAITNDTVFVSTGSKVDGIVEKEELMQDGELSCAVGDVLDLYVVHVSPQEVRLSKVVRGAGSLSVLEDAKNAALPVEGKVTAIVKGGFSVDIMRRRAFCPASQMDVRPVNNQEALVGKTFNFLITKLEQNGKNIVLSRRAILEAQNAESRAAFMAEIKEGDVLEGTVVRLTPFGAFIELSPGVEGLVHVSEISWSKNQQPDEVFSLDDKVRVKIIGITQGEKGEKISLSIRQITEDPWNSVDGRITAGEVITGKIVRLADFGAFVEILPGIEGLIHISELSYEKRVHKAEEVVAVGEEVNVKVKEIDLEKHRISLSLRDAAGDPWASVAEDFPVETEHTGKVERRATFGLFISLAPGITALMPNSFINNVRGKSKIDKLVPGDEIQVTIHEVNLSDRKLTIGPAGEDAEEVLNAKSPDGKPGRGGKGRQSQKNEERDWKQHTGQAGSGFGTLGAALAAAMDKKKP